MRIAVGVITLSKAEDCLYNRLIFNIDNLVALIVVHVISSSVRLLDRQVCRQIGFCNKLYRRHSVSADTDELSVILADNGVVFYVLLRGRCILRDHGTVINIELCYIIPGRSGSVPRDHNIACCELAAGEIVTDRF